MDISFIRERITLLRLQKGVSEYQMSYDLGHSRGYINNISSGKVLPSMAEFLSICEYFHITPSEFFDEGIRNPSRIEEATRLLRTLSDDDLLLVVNTLKRLQKNPD